MARKIRSGKNLPDKPPKPQAVNPLHTPITLSYKFVDVGGDFCLSQSEQDEVRGVSDCLRKMTTLTWQQVLQQGGKGPNKTGLAYTTYKDIDLRGVTRHAQLSPDIPIAGVRASEKSRVFGAYINHVWYVLWFDPKHSIVPV
jgi:hypothetical protein